MGLALVGSLSVAAWAYLLIARGGWWRRFPQLSGRNAPDREPSVAVVIPGRNEAPYIAEAISSLAGKHVIVVDDNSSDTTGDIARLHGATVINGAPLPPGWTGKMWAVAQGVAAASTSHPDYLLLTDADVVHAPGSTSQLIAKAEEGRFDLVSLMVLLRTESLAERALIPAFVFFFLMLYPPPLIENPSGSTAGAAGGCMLIRREMLERIGGIEAIRGELIDDCALAQAVKQCGGKLWLGLTRDTRSIREYGGFTGIWSMISRTAFTQLHYSPVLLCGTLAGLTIVYIAPPVLALTFQPLASSLDFAAWLLMSLAYTPILRFYRSPLFWAPALPLIALVYAGATIDSAVRYWTGRGGTWKGRAQALRTRTE
jgi:hopene-associated glycosyltransferase HpnB